MTPIVHSGDSSIGIQEKVGGQSQMRCAVTESDARPFRIVAMQHRRRPPNGSPQCPRMSDGAQAFLYAELAVLHSSGSAITANGSKDWYPRSASAAE